MARHRLGAQAWLRGEGSGVPSAELIQPVTAGEVPRKPVGGLWTSTWDPRRGSGWIQWCLAEDWGARPLDVWILDPHRSARVYVIEDERDRSALDERYGTDWALVARDYDGVNVTARGVHKTGLGRVWLCESTLWFRWSFTRTRRVGPFRPR